MATTAEPMMQQMAAKTLRSTSMTIPLALGLAMGQAAQGVEII
jgi:cytochrome bd-type quinol oxidase subunit 2